MAFENAMNKIKSIILYFTVLIFGLAILVPLSKNLWSRESIEVSFRSKASEPVAYQIFYTSKPTDVFSEKKSVRTTAKSGDESVKIVIPETCLQRFRLDIDPRETQESNVSISNLEIKGKKSFIVEDYAKECRFNQPQQFTIEKDKLKVVAKRKVDAYFQFIKPLCIEQGIHIDWLVLISIIVLGILVISKLLTYIIRFKLLSEGRIRDIIFLLVFFLMLVVPASNINDAKKSETENRMLAEKPLVDKLFDEAYQYGAKFDEWFSDRFYGREYLVKLHSLIGWGASKIGNDRVLCGKDNWLFYKKELNLEDYMNVHPADEKQLQSAARYVAEIKKWCEANEKKFYYIIAPNKHRVYDEFYRGVRKQKPDSESMINRFLPILRVAGMEAIYPIKELKKAKKDDMLYWKHDTHWTTVGAWIGYKSLMQEICKSTPDIEIFVPTFRPAQNYGRDLEAMYPETVKDTPEGYKELCFRSDVSVSGLPISSRGITIVKNAHRKGNVVVLRDSFTTALAPYLNETFGSVCYIWSRRVSKEEVDKYLKPADIVILETVERYVPNLSNCKFPY